MVVVVGVPRAIPTAVYMVVPILFYNQGGGLRRPGRRSRARGPSALSGPDQKDRTPEGVLREAEILAPFPP